MSEVVNVTGQAGNFQVTVRQEPRYVDPEKCIACGLCAQKCPKKVDDEFNMGLGKRKAIYIKYGQAVPLKYVIDPQNCIYLTRNKCRACEKFCPTGAINFQDQEKFHNINVGSVILAPGFKPFDPSKLDSYGYGQIPDVVTSLEYERLLSASGPYLGHLVRPSDEREPQKVAWIQCVGSRNTNQCENGYCSSVCCMYAIKQALVTEEHLSGTKLSQSIFNMDIRTHGKEFERYYEQAKQKGINFIKARPHTIEPGPQNRGVNLKFTLENGKQVEEYYDLVVLSIGLEAPQDAQQLAQTFGLELNQDLFVRTSTFGPVSSSRPGIFVTGAFQGPKDIPQAVAEASTAAAEAASILRSARNTLSKEKVYPQEIDILEQSPRIGVFVCSCGINIANVVDVQAVCEYAQGLPNVVFVENNMFTCSADTQGLIAEKIKEHNLNRIVIAACTPRTHEPLFQDTLKNAGLNGYLVEMANIRNQNSWVHQDCPDLATQKAKDQVRMAVAKVSKNYPLKEFSVDIVQRGLVIGGGVSGLSAALALAEQGFETILVEQSEQLGGNALKLSQGVNEFITPQVEELIAKVRAHKQLTIHTQTEVQAVEGTVGHFRTKLKTQKQELTLEHGIAIIATGARESRPEEYFYGENERVLTHHDLDRLLTERPQVFSKANSCVFIQCVGSRDNKRPYCSRVCCTHSVEKAIMLKQANPELNIYILYRDMRTYGSKEHLYKQARDLGVIFIRYTLDNKPEVIQDPDGTLWINAFDSIADLDLKIAADYLVLAAAIEPNENNQLVEQFKFSVNEDGFYNEAHPKLRPVDMSVDGLFVAGLCNYPKPIDEAIAQAKAAASRAALILSKHSLQLEPIKSEVTELCDGCALCLDVCPYQALSLEVIEKQGQTNKKIHADPALCKGCGLCAATCPKGGIIVHGFTPEQLQAQVDSLLIN